MITREHWPTVTSTDYQEMERFDLAITYVTRCDCIHRYPTLICIAATSSVTTSVKFIKTEARRLIGL